MSRTESVLVGSFCAPIKIFHIDESGTFHYQDDIPSSGPSPSYIIQSPCKRFMYCTVETEDAATSQVMSFQCINEEKFTFDILSSQPAGGGAPCFLSVDVNNNYLFVSNYFGGNVTVFPINKATGVLSPMCQEISFNTPLAPNLPFNRGTGHCHQTVHLEHSQHILLCELGQNAVYTFEFTPPQAEECVSPPQAEECVSSQPCTVLKQSHIWVAPPDSGPRHLAVHPSEKFVYVLCEIACTVIALRMDPTTGMITSPSALNESTSSSNSEVLQCYSTLREAERSLPSETMNAAEILLSHDARFLYISNRDVNVNVGKGVGVSLGDNGLSQSQSQLQSQFMSRCSIAVFSVQGEGGELQHIQQVSSLGCHPRAMTLLHGGSHLAVANKDGGYFTKSPSETVTCSTKVEEDPTVNTDTTIKRGGGNMVVFPIAHDTTGFLLVDDAVVTDNLDLALDVELLEPTWIHPFVFN